MEITNDGSMYTLTDDDGLVVGTFIEYADVLAYAAGLDPEPRGPRRLAPEPGGWATARDRGHSAG